MDLEFKSDRIRLVAFTPGLQDFPTARVAGELLAQLPELRGDPLVLPIPAGSPAGIPRIILKDQSGDRQLQIAPSRAELSFGRKPTGVLDRTQAVKWGLDAMEILFGVLGTRPNRLALIANSSAPHEEPAAYLVESFARKELAEGFLKDAYSFDVNVLHHRTLFEGLRVNSLIRVQTGTVNLGAGNVPAVLIEHDVNTLTEESSSRQLDRDAASNFFNRANEMFDVEIRGLFH